MSVLRQTLTRGAAVVARHPRVAPYVVRAAALSRPPDLGLVIPPYVSVPSADEVPESSPDFVDVRDLIARTAPADLLAKAEAYFASALASPDALLAKPFGSASDVWEVLGRFCALVQGLDVSAEMTVLDFGVGTGWTSRIFTQLGCEVVALDVSPTALELGRQLYDRMPPLGDQPAPRFLVFDGETIDLPDESVDRICCSDAFHHAVNPRRVLAEMARVLKPGGIAGFSEPGLRHSRQRQAQFEMRTFGVVENDVDLDEIGRWAIELGLGAPRIAVVGIPTAILSMDQRDDLMAGGGTALAMLDVLREAQTRQNMFFLSKAGAVVTDSRGPAGLLADLALTSVTRVGNVVSGSFTVTNTGTALWRPSTAPRGPVRLGVRLVTPSSSREGARSFLPGGVETAPGEVVEVPFAIDLGDDADDPGLTLVFDMVSEGVTWFTLRGSRTVEIRVVELA